MPAFSVLDWMRRMLVRELRMVDMQIMAALQNGTAFFATTAPFAIGGRRRRGKPQVRPIATATNDARPTTKAVASTVADSRNVLAILEKSEAAQFVDTDVMAARSVRIRQSQKSPKKAPFASASPDPATVRNRAANTMLPHINHTIVRF